MDQPGTLVEWGDISGGKASVFSSIVVFAGQYNPHPTPNLLSVTLRVPDSRINNL